MAEKRPSNDAWPGTADGRRRTRAGHFGGFVVSGSMAFATDALVLEAGVRLLGVTPPTARIPAIAAAMVVGWLAHRSWTFQVTASPSIPEFIRYVLAAWVAALFNWGLFTATLFVWPEVFRLAALALASGGAMIFSYLTMRYRVFKP